MALPPQAIEKLVREPSRTQGAYRELLLISGALFGLAIIIYAGLAFGYGAYLRSTLAAVDEEIRTFNSGISEEDRAEVQGFYSQLVNLRTLLADHTTASPVLDILELTVQPDVYYTKLTLNNNTNQVVLAGNARSLDAVAAQAAALQGAEQVARVDFNNAGAQSEGPWQFTMTVYLEPDVSHGTVIVPEAPAAPEAPVSAESTTTPAAPPATTTPATP